MATQIRTKLLELEHWLNIAEAVTIETPDEAKLANDLLREAIGLVAWVKEQKDGFVAPAKDMIRHAEAWFDPALKTVSAAESLIRERLRDWTIAQQRLADERRRAQEAEERAARQKAEQQAAAARAKADAEAAEKRRQAEAQLEAQRNAEAEGNAKAAAAAAAAAAKLTEQAAAVVENAEAKAMEIQTAVVSAVAPAQEPEKVKGFGLRDNWKAQLKGFSTEEQALEMIVTAIAAGRRDMLPLLKIDWSACDKLAKAQKTVFAVPGLEAVNKQISTSRAA
jgi:hypothetical protein